MFAQPIVEAHTGRLVEEELLVRMEGSDGALIALTISFRKPGGSA